MAGERTILVVEDDAAVQRVTQRAVESFGYAAMVVDDASSAIAATRQCGGSLCCVLLDYSLKHGTGAQALVQFRAIDGELPVLILSGYPREAIEATTGPLADAGFLQKPYTLDALRDAIEAIRRD
jgi:DNA-binding NtrC family response regulator